MWDKEKQAVPVVRHHSGVSFFQQVEYMMSKNPEKPIMTIAEKLQVAESTAKLSEPDVILYYF